MIDGHAKNLDSADRGGEVRRRRWERSSELPLTLAALAFLVAYAWPILDPDRRDGTTGAVLRWVVIVTWGMFAIDYAARWALSSQRVKFVRSNLLDLAAVALPLFRPLRLLRLVKVLGVMNRTAGASLRGRVVVYVVGSAALVVFVAALAVLDAERSSSQSNIGDFGTALWWALTTVTTVGYGDHFPVTLEGRFAAAGLMLAGIALLGVVTASFASWLLESVTKVEEEQQAATRREVLALAEEIAALRRELGQRERLERER